jgi:O-antigen/teichoic acid export membrane protein
MTIFVARAVSPEQAGLFFLAIGLITLFARIGVLGMNVTSIRFIGASAAEADWGRTHAIARFTWYRVSIVLFSISILLYFSSPTLANQVFDKPEFAQVLAAMSPSLFALGGCILLSSQLQALRHTSASIFVLSIGIPIGVAICTWALPVSSAVHVSWAYVFSATATLIIGLFWWHAAAPTAEEPKIIHSEIWASSMPMWVTAIMGSLTLWSGQLIAGIWVSAEEIANLAIAHRTANLVSFILIAVNLVVAPRFAALYKQEKMKELQALAIASVKLILVVGTPVVLLILFFPDVILGLFGPNFSEAIPLLIILTVGQFVNVVTGSVGVLLSMSGHERDLRNIVLFAGPFAIISALILTPYYGVTGAAMATATALSLQNIGCVWLVRKRLGFNTLAIWKSP